MYDFLLYFYYSTTVKMRELKSKKYPTNNQLVKLKFDKNYF